MPVVLGATTAKQSPAATVPRHGPAIHFFTAQMMAAIANAELGTRIVTQHRVQPKKFSIAIPTTHKCSA